MLALQCPLCDHANPEDAKFCNACGSRLQLKICPHCEAVNNQSVEICHQCGALFPLSITPSEVAARAARERLQEIQQLLRNNAAVTAAMHIAPVAPSANEGAVDQRAVTIVESTPERRGEPRRWARSKSAMAGALLAFLIASAIAVATFHIDDSAPVTESQAMQRDATITQDLDTGATPIRHDVSQVVATTPTEPPMTIAPTTVASMPAADQAALAASLPAETMRSEAVSKGPGSPVPTTKPVPPRVEPKRNDAGLQAVALQGIVCTDATVAAGLCPSIPSAPRAEDLRPSRTAAMSPGPTDDPTPFVTPAATHATTAADRTEAAPPSPRPSACTGAIAAVGLCSLNSIHRSN